MGKMFSCVEDICDYLNGYRLNKKSETASSIGIVFEENGRYHWYDNGTCKVLQIDESLQSLFSTLLAGEIDKDEVKNLIEIENIDIGEFLAVVNKEDLLKGVEIENLASNFYLKYVHRQIQSGVSQLILELTEVCNMRCKYCIYQDSYEGNRNFGSKSMSRETAFKAIDLMKEEGDKEKVAITFYGGEPLVEFSLMRDCIEYTKEKLEDREVSYSFTTNLSLLTDEMIEYFKTVDNLSIMCSIDGPKEIHDRYRVFANGGGTFEKVFENFKKLSTLTNIKTDFNLSVNAVYAPPYSVDKVEEINKFFKGLDFLPEDFNFQLGYPSLDTLPKNIEPEFYLDDYSLQDWYRDNLNKDGFLEELKETGLDRALEGIHNRNITNNASNNVGLNGCCTPAYRRLYVQSDGNFLPCERTGYSASLGNVENGIDLHSIYGNYIFPYSEIWTEECNDCWASKLCSACYVDRVSIKGVKKELNSSLCDYEREGNLLSLQKYHQLLHENPSVLAKFNKN